MLHQTVIHIPLRFLNHNRINSCHSSIEGSADLRVAQEMLGHESITTTEIYTHLDRSYLRQVILDHHPLEKKN